MTNYLEYEMEAPLSFKSGGKGRANKNQKKKEQKSKDGIYSSKHIRQQLAKKEMKEDLPKKVLKEMKSHKKPNGKNEKRKW